MVTVEQTEKLQDVLPIVPLDLGTGVPAKQHKLQGTRIVDVGGDVEQVLAGPPSHDGGGKPVGTRGEKRDTAGDRHQDLQEAPAEGGHQIAEWGEQDVAGFV